MHWILSPEPKPDQVKGPPVPVVEDLLMTKDFLESKDSRSWFSRQMVVSPQQIQTVANATIGQRDNTLWCLVRKLRLTASNFGKVLKAINRNR